MISIIYKEKILYTVETEEECADILLELAEKSYNGELDPNEIKLEEN